VGWVFREWKGLPRVKKSFHEWKNADVVGKSILEAWCPSNPGVYPNRVFFQSGYSSKPGVHPAPCVYKLSC